MHDDLQARSIRKLLADSGQVVRAGGHLLAVHGTWWSNYSVADLRETFPFHVTTLLQKDNHWSGESLSAALMLPSPFILHPTSFNITGACTTPVH